MGGVVAGPERLQHDVRLGPAGVRAEVAGGEVGAAVAATGGGRGGRGRGGAGRGTLAGAALARGEPAAHHAVRAEVTRHPLAVGCGELR